MFNNLLNTLKDTFDKKVFTQIVLPEEDQIAAQIAQESYNSQDRQKIIHDYSLDEKNSSHGYCVYFNLEKKICII